MMLAGPRSSTQVGTLTMDELDEIIKEKVAKQVEKRQYLFNETFIGSVILAVVTAYVTQRLLKGSK